MQPTPQSLPPSGPEYFAEKGYTVDPGQPKAEAGAKPGDAAAKGSAVGIALLVHALVLMLLAFIVMQTMREDVPELIVESSSIEPVVKVDPKKFARSSRPDPSSPSMSKTTVITSIAPANITVPSVEDADGFEIGSAEGFGAGLGIGTGGSGGGGVGFFGNRTMASRVVFIVDVSASLSEKQFEMIKEELTSSLMKLAATVQYQVIFFAGPAWFAEDEFVGRNKKKFTIKHGNQEYVWTTPGGANQFELQNRKDLPTAKWKSATRANLYKTKKDIEQVRKIFGTDWEWPLKVALQQMEPKPDVVYFLTDGVTSGVDATLKEIEKINRSKGKKAKINTIAMMQPKAAASLRQLAKESGGQFSIVNADGSVTLDKMRGGDAKKPAKKKPKK